MTKEEIIDNLTDIKRACINIDIITKCAKRLKGKESYDAGCTGCILEKSCTGFNPVATIKEVDAMILSLSGNNGN